MTDTFTVAPWDEKYPGVVEGKPSFTFRFMTIGEVRKLAAIMGDTRQVRVGREIEEADKLAAFLEPFRVQAEGEPATTLAAAFDAMMPYQVDRLAWRIRVANRLGPDEKKGSESPSPTNTGYANGWPIRSTIWLPICA